MCHSIPLLQTYTRAQAHARWTACVLRVRGFLLEPRVYASRPLTCTLSPTLALAFAMSHLHAARKILRLLVSEAYDSSQAGLSISNCIQVFFHYHFPYAHTGSRLEHPGRLGAVLLFLASFIWPHVKLGLLHYFFHARIRPSTRRNGEWLEIVC